MAGLYLHIPFCKSRCIYCGFYSTTRSDLKQRYVDALCHEMEMRLNNTSPTKHEESRELSLGNIETIYIGGGTPSQLTIEQLRQIFDSIQKNYLPGSYSNEMEVTLECNPDDITDNFAEAIQRLPVNRVSMGVQTFDNNRLRFLHRRHTAEQIPVAIARLRNHGIQNISIDLMYGFPNEGLHDCQQDIERAVDLNVEHISAYCLMVEEGTKLYDLKARDEQAGITHSRFVPAEEETELAMYTYLIERLQQAGYEQYEISNFARPGHHSRHNSNYWNQTPYIGLGASAHSYDGQLCRRWNIDNIIEYIEGIEHEKPVFDFEMLDEDTRYNELVMTALRTNRGLNLHILTPEQQSFCLHEAQQLIKNGLLVRDADHLRLSRKGLFVSNMVMSQLMKV